MRRRLGGALAVALLLAAACSDGEGSLPEEGPETTAPSSITTTTTNEPTEDPLPPVAAPDPDPSPLPIDPEVRIGTLENGLTYYLRSNDSPGASLDLRLVVDAGSIHQSAPDDGSAHFLEHMLFNGTEQFPGNELDRSLQRLGIRFGPELNAFTSFDETVYLLNATTSDPTAVEIAFDVLAQWASAATLDPAAIAGEVGVVREELRFRRETSDGIVQSAFDDIYTAGTVYEGHSPIGSEAGITSTDAERLRSFYDHWYRPDNLALVVVGDLPVDRMEREIVERFEELQARTQEPPADVDRTVGPDPSPTTDVVTHPDQVVENLSFDIPLTAWDLGTVGGERLVVMETVLARMLTNRLDEAFVGGDLALDTPPGVGAFDINRAQRYFGTNFQSGDMLAGIDDFMAVLLAAARTGFSVDDLAAAGEWYGAALDADLDTLATRQDRVYADEYMLHFLQGSGIDAVPSRVDRQRALLDDLTPEELTDHWRWILQIGGPIVVAVGADADELPSPAELLATIEGARAGSDGDAVRAVDELMARPDPVDPVSSTTGETPFYDSTSWTFANGATVVHAFSDVVLGSVDVQATANGGWSRLPEGSGAITDLVTLAVDESGVGDVGPLELDRYLDRVTLSLSSFIDETEEGFVGSTASQDLEILFQLLHLGITSPRADETAVRIARNQAENRLALAETNPSVRAATELVDARTGDDAWYRLTPTPAQINALEADAVLDLRRQRLGQVDDLVVAVVGDIDDDTVEDLARRYVGTLPAGPNDTWIDRLPSMPAGVTTRQVPLDDDVTAAGIDLLYSTDITIDGDLEVTASVLETILRTRMLELLREELGASYTLEVSVVTTRRPRPSIDTLINVQGDPDRLDEILATLDTEIDRLVDEGPRDDEFDRAVTVLANEYDFIDNGLFLDALLAEAHFPEADRLEPAQRASVLSGVTSRDVQALARRLFVPEQRIEVIRTPS